MSLNNNQSKDTDLRLKGTNMQMNLTRRDFIRSTATATFAAAVFPTIIPGSALGKNGAVAPSNRISVGVIGCGPQGVGDMQNFLAQKDCQVVAVCDVKTDRIGVAKDTVNKAYGNQDCKTYHDFRELVARQDIDACLIATPDHWHVLTALAAVKSGKDVYLEKPLAVALEEGQALRKAVRKHKRVFQFGTQQRSARMFWQACQLVRNGRIGKLQHINVWAPGSSPGGSLKQVPPPPGLDYEFWLGPAPMTPHTEDRCSDDGYRKTWWFTSDYAIGFISGWGVHPMDIAVWGGGELLSGVVEIEGRGTFRNTEGVCDTATVWEVDFKFGSGVTMKFTGVPNGHNEGKPTGDPWLYRDQWKSRYRRIEDHGTAFEGSEGWIHVDRSGINLQPENLIDVNPESLAVKLIHSPGHVRNFLDCIKSRADTVCPIEAAVAADTFCHLADTATRLGRKLRFDFRTEQFLDDKTANQRLKARPMRQPWRV
ncbi:MAG: Gfo/Idh/MocA family oxidoreductase [Verrucomicrobia bacterium]|nr:Gfo/Idh/MocA family oxidoreductase [Verrucomicrobiota bacterium]